MGFRNQAFVCVLVALSGCAPGPGSEPAPSRSPLVVPTLSFREKLRRDEARLPDRISNPTRRRWVERISACLRSDKRTAGDRYACLATLGSLRLRLGEGSAAIRRQALELIRPILAAPSRAAGPSGDLHLARALQSAAIELAASPALHPFLTNADRAGIAASGTEDDTLDSLFPEKASIRSSIASGVEESR